MRHIKGNLFDFVEGRNRLEGLEGVAGVSIPCSYGVQTYHKKQPALIHEIHNRWGTQFCDKFLTINTRLSVFVDVVSGYRVSRYNCSTEEAILTYDSHRIRKKYVSPARIGQSLPSYMFKHNLQATIASIESILPSLQMRNRINILIPPTFDDSSDKIAFYEWAESLETDRLVLMTNLGPIPSRIRRQQLRRRHRLGATTVTNQYSPPEWDVAQPLEPLP